MLQEYRKKALLMGSAFEFTIVTDSGADTAALLLEAAVGEVRRMEQLLTEFDPESSTSLVNKNAGRRAVQVPAEMYQLLERCQAISRLTKGAFDISAGGLKKCYTFSNGPGVFPAPATLASALDATGFEKIRLLPQQEVYLEMPGMHIGFGGIGKGYAADCVQALLRAKGVESGVIDASGDLTAWGLRPDGQPWKVGIGHPDQPDQLLLWLPVQAELYMATSGNYENYFEFEGIRYGHTIDPRNGRPVQDLKSVTVLSPSAELSDALATAVTVLGITDGLELLNQLPDTHGILVAADNQVFYSKKLQVTHDMAPI
jgi:thiamine biosynthesis lipoprotein